MQAYLTDIRAAAKTHSPGLPELICRFLAAATDSDEKIWRKQFWEKTFDGLIQLQSTNEFAWKPPILLFPDEMDKKNSPWLYTGRDWYFWLHVFTSWYDWTEEHIANLEIEDAFALMQEILFEKQLQQEWEWSLSDKSVSYDEKTKRAYFNTLPRPNWMLPKMPKIIKMKIPESMMPVGVVNNMFTTEAVPETK